MNKLFATESTRNIYLHENYCQNRNFTNWFCCMISCQHTSNLILFPFPLFVFWKTSNIITKILYLSAPAHDNILLIRITWNGCSRTRMWKASLPQFFTKYLLAQMRHASKASEDSCSYSSDTMWIHNGKSSTRAFLRPKSKIRILGSGKKVKT